VTLTDRDRKIVLVIVPLLLAVAYWFFLLAPKRQEAAKAEDESAKQEQRLATVQQAVSVARTAKTDFRADYAEIVRLGKAIPASMDMPSLLVQLDSAAEGTGINFTKIATGERTASGAGAASTTPPPAPTTPPAAGTPASGAAPAQSAPGAAAQAANGAAQTSDQRNAAAGGSGVAPSDTQTSTSSGGGLPVGGAGAAPAGLETVPLELEFVGNFFNLADFFHRTKRFVQVVNQDVVVSGRLLTIETVKWSSDPELFPKIKAELIATVYLSPKAQGVTAGATPQGPTSPPTTTPADGPTPPVPAAPTAVATP